MEFEELFQPCQAAAQVSPVVPARFTESGQLLDLLCQFPQRFHLSDANRQWIMDVRRRLNGAPLAVEFRHHSWDRADVYEWLGAEGITLVSVDVPDIAALFPRKLVQAGDDIYVRLHSRRAESWYGEGGERYDYLYSEQEMSEWIDALERTKEKARRAMILFNNCRRANAVINAQQMMQLLSRRAFTLVAPSPAGADQGTLF